MAKVMQEPEVEKETEKDQPVEGVTPDDGDGETLKKKIDFDKWLGEQPEEIRDALAERDEKKDKGLTSALKKERESRREADRELEAKERERQAAQEAKLLERGEYKELLATSKKEVAKLQASEKARVFRDETRQALKESNLDIFTDVLMGPNEKVEDIIERGETLRKMIDDEVESEVAKRLNTGKVPKGGGTPVPTAVKLTDMSEDDKRAFIKEHGLDEWTDFVQAAQ